MASDNRILTYRQVGQVKLKCTIYLDRLFPDELEKERFDSKWDDFFNSDENNEALFEISGNKLTYDSEQLIPLRADNKTPLLLVLGNPASHSVKNGLFFAFKDNRKENRFWKHILKPAGILNLSYNQNMPAKTLNRRRKEQLYNLNYHSPFRIGLCVFITIPSAPGGPWGGVAGIHKLIGAKAMRRLEAEESRRVVDCAKRFFKRKGAIVTFQKNGWNALRSEKDPAYSIEMANQGKLIGALKEMSHIPIYGVPPTRLSGPCQRVLSRFFTKQDNRF